MSKATVISEIETLHESFFLTTSCAPDSLYLGINQFERFAKEVIDKDGDIGRIYNMKIYRVNLLNHISIGLSKKLLSK